MGNAVNIEMENSLQIKKVSINGTRVSIIDINIDRKMKKIPIVTLTLYADVNWITLEAISPPSVE